MRPHPRHVLELLAETVKDRVLVESPQPQSVRHQHDHDETAERIERQEALRQRFLRGCVGSRLQDSSSGLSLGHGTGL